MNKYGKYVILLELDKTNKSTIRSDWEAVAHATCNFLLKGVYNASGWLLCAWRQLGDDKRWWVLYLAILGLLLLISAGM